MARKFAELEAKLSAQAIARSDERYREMVAKMPLHELRRARGMSQETLAKALHIKQPNVAKLEKRTDIYISTLRGAIEAMGGTLDIIARFPDGRVKITNFSSIDKDETVVCDTGASTP
jgi:transcriptional regulator with XRE-family HTH domain